MVALTTLVTLTYAAVALLLFSFERQSRLALAMAGCGVCISVQWIGVWNWAFLPFTGVQANAWFYVFAIWGLLQYPDRGRLRPWERALLLFAILELGGLQLLITLISEPEWSGYSSDVWWPAFSNRSLFDLMQDLVGVFDAILAIAFITVLLLKLRRLTGLDRLLSIPVAIGFMSLAVVSAAVSLETSTFPTPNVTGWYLALTAGALLSPIGFAVAIWQRRARHVSVADTLARRFAGEAASLESVTAALQEGLHDPSLEVFYWVQEMQAYVDTEGRPVPPGGLASALVKEVRATDGSNLALISTDKSLVRHSGILRTALNSSALALENASLQAKVKAQLEEVTRSRARIAEAANAERIRIERDLHDGIQQRLLAVSARLGLARKQVDSSEAVATLEHASADLRSTISELRALVHGIHPPELSQFGLHAAVEVVLESLPMEVHSDITSERFDSQLELTAYFVISEAMSNVLKHSSATMVDVVVRAVVTQEDDQLRCLDVGQKRLQVIVTDNGRGGAEPGDGSGLTGLADRVHSAGGSFFLKSLLSSGTTIVAELPIR